MFKVRLHVSDLDYITPFNHPFLKQIFKYLCACMHEREKEKKKKQVIKINRERNINN